MRNLMMTKEIAKVVEKTPLYSQEGKGKDAKVIAKYFLGSYTWYVTEGEKQEDGDYLFFGLVVNQYGEEWGFFTLSDLSSILVRNMFKVERDVYSVTPLKNTLNNLLK